MALPILNDLHDSACRFFFPWLLLAAISSAAAQQGDTRVVFEIRDIAAQSELDDVRVDQVLENGHMADLLKVRRGKNRVVTFVAPRGGGCVEGPCLVHDVVMLEVDSRSRVVNGLYFVLEWKEFPPTIWRVTRPGRLLKAGVSILELGFDFDEVDAHRVRSGVLTNTYKSKRVLTPTGLH